MSEIGKRNLRSTLWGVIMTDYPALVRHLFFEGPAFRSGISPRIFPSVLLSCALGLFFGSTGADANGCNGRETLLLRNGRIYTLDGNNTVSSAVTIQNGRFLGVGAANAPHVNDACTRQIDLHGRVVIPGIIDTHDHIVELGLRPGHDTRLENSTSINDVLIALQTRASTVPAGEWITALGGFTVKQFASKTGSPRFPALPELDLFVKSNPVLLFEGFTGPSVTNSLGRTFFRQQGVIVAANGAIESGPNSLRALNRLRRLDEANGARLSNQMRGTMDALSYAASLGITTHLDQGGFPAAGDDTDSLAAVDRYRYLDAIQALWREGKLINRIRVNFLHLENDLSTPELQARLQNAVPYLGDEWLAVHGIGEFTANGFAEAAPQWKNGTRKVAFAWQNGWSNENHSLTHDDFKTIVDEWAKVDQELKRAGIPQGITERRWVVAHAPYITRDYVDKLKALGGGINTTGGWPYLYKGIGDSGPPFRMILDSGIHFGLSSDAAQIAPLNPWIGMYYAIMGKNVLGNLINDGQQISRIEALRLYTSSNGWFLREEREIGSIEKGKRADLVVLSDDYFTVPVDKIKDIKAMLTMVNGRVVYDEQRRQRGVSPLPASVPRCQPPQGTAGQERPSARLVGPRRALTIC